MKYLERHLSFHDRYLKIHNKVFCHMSIKMLADLLKALFCNRRAPRLKPSTAARLLSDDDYENQIRRNNWTNGEDII